MYLYDALLIDFAGVCTKPFFVKYTEKSFHRLKTLGTLLIDLETFRTIARRQEDIWLVCDHSNEQFWKAIVDDAGMEWNPSWTASLMEDYLGSIVLDEEVLRIVKEVRNDGIITGLISDAGPAQSKVMHEVQQKWDLWDFMLISCALKTKKPGKEIFEHAKREIAERGISDPKRAVFFDDKQKNADGASAVGLVGKRYSGNPAEILQMILTD